MRSSRGATPVSTPGRWYHTAAMSLAASGQTQLTFDATDVAYPGITLDGGDLVWGGGASTLAGHLSVQYTGVALLSAITVRVIRIRAGVPVELRNVPWRSVLTAGAAALPDVQVSVPVVADDRIRVTLEPSGTILAIPLVVGSTHTHLDLGE